MNTLEDINYFTGCYRTTSISCCNFAPFLVLSDLSYQRTQKLLFTNVAPLTRKYNGIYWMVLSKFCIISTSKFVTKRPATLFCKHRKYENDIDCKLALSKSNFKTVTFNF